MRKSAIILLFILISLRGLSQVTSIDSFYLPGTTWIEVTGRPQPSGELPYKEGYTRFVIEKDSSINGSSYHIISAVDMFVRTYPITGPGPTADAMTNTYYPLFGGIRVDGRKVYFLLFYNVGLTPLFESNAVPGDRWQHMVNDGFSVGAERLIYDFGLQPGDVMPIKGVPLSSIEDTVQLSNAIAKHYIFPQTGEEDKWIEGVGSQRGLFASLMNNAYWPWHRLMCYQGVENSWGGCNITTGTEEAITRDAVVFYPNPLSGDMLHIKGAQDIVSVSIIDISGKVNEQHDIHKNQTSISSSLATGLYFIKVQYADGSTETQKLLKR